MDTRKSSKQGLIRTSDGRNFLAPFILVTSLFLLWGFAHSILDVLNKHFQVILGVTKAQSGFVQAAVYGGYFIMAIPAGIIMKKYGYKKGILLGLLLYASGAFLFYPAIHIQQFWAFLFALFIIALGLTCLETAANPYVTVLGPPERSAQRINLSQSFNGLGWVIGPIAGSLILFATTSESNAFATLAIPYIGIGVIVLLVALLFYYTKLPDIEEAVMQDVEEGSDANSGLREAYRFLSRYPHFKFAVIAQLFYVAAQTGINSFFINYVTEVFQHFENQEIYGESALKNIIQWVGELNPGISGKESLYNTTAGLMLSFSFGLFTIGRFSGSLLLTWFKPGRLLTLFSIANIILTIIVINGTGLYGIIALVLIYFFMSIMFPTIFALGLKGLGNHTRHASSLIVMAIVGGAIFTPLMGYIADLYSMRIGFIIPLASFFIVMLFAVKGIHMKPRPVK